MKVFGIVIIFLGIIVAYIGITGSQHRVMDIIKGINLSGSDSGGSQSTGTKSSNPGGTNTGASTTNPGGKDTGTPVLA